MRELTPFTCADTFRRLDDYLDRELTPDELERVRRHLETCAICAAEFRYEERVIRAVRSRLQRLEVPADLCGRVWRAVTEAKRSDPPPGPAGSREGST